MTLDLNPPCPACGSPTVFPLRFCEPCRDSGAAAEWSRQHQPPRPEHAPGHPIGAHAGPPGMSARFCLLADCDWRDTVRSSR